MLQCRYLVGLVTMSSFLLIVEVNQGNCALIEEPQNVAIVIGETVTLRCETNITGGKLQWYIETNEPESLIFNGANIMRGKELYRAVQSIPEQVYLTFRASAENAGRYYCYEPGPGTKAPAEVIVIETLSTYAIESDSSASHMTCACSVRFIGHWAPNIYWVYEQQHVPKSKTNDSVHGNLSTSTLNVSRESTHLPVCHAKFIEENYLGGAKAQNIPEFHNYSSSCLLDPGLDISRANNASDPTNTPGSPGNRTWIIVAAITIPVAMLITGAYCFTKSRQSRSAQITGHHENGTNGATTELENLYTKSSTANGHANGKQSDRPGRGSIC